MNDVLLGTGDVAKELEIPAYRLDYLLRVGRLPDRSVKVGGNRRLWTTDQVEELRNHLFDYDERRRKVKEAKDAGK